jgi:hypothetical protein
MRYEYIEDWEVLATGEIVVRQPAVSLERALEIAKPICGLDPLITVHVHTSVGGAIAHIAVPFNDIRTKPLKAIQEAFDTKTDEHIATCSKNL